MPADFFLSTKPRVVTLPMEFTESVIIGVNDLLQPVERDADDWFQGADGFPSWLWRIPLPSDGWLEPAPPETFTSWRLVVATPTGVTRAVKSFAPIRLRPGDSLTLNWSIHTWGSMTVDGVRRLDDD